MSAELKLARACLTIGQSEQQVSAADKYCSEAAQLCLARWLSLPNIVSYSHIPLLHMFQQIVEIQESATVVNTMQVAASGKVNGDLSTIFDTWRHRMPNIWDDMTVWHDILGWRVVVFEKMGLHPARAKKDAAAPTAPTAPAPGSNETAYTLIQLAHVACLHKLRGLCSKALGAFTRITNVLNDDVFTKLREQVHIDLFSWSHDIMNDVALFFFALFFSSLTVADQMRDADRSDRLSGSTRSLVLH
jgi:transformation/transcription domain-associated protein